VYSCPYYDVSDEAYARFNGMIATMNEPHEHFVSEMREFSLLHEIDPSLPIPRIKSSLYDYCQSSLPLESNVVDGAPSIIDIEEVVDHPFTSLLLITLSFSSYPIATSVGDLTLLASSSMHGVRDG